MTRRALIVGINDYKFAPLKGCVNDAKGISEVLLTHENQDEDDNFSCKLLISSEIEITKAKLIKEIQSLFNKDGEIALLYFSGHGALTDLGGYLVTQDATKYNEGVLLSQIIQMANDTRKVREIFIILDCCHSGNMGNLQVLSGETAVLRKGLSILSSSLENEYSVEQNGKGLFTSIIIEALKGAAADITGIVTSASIYSYVDKILGPWDQRPVFKAHVSELTALKKCKPLVPRSLLKMITEYFNNDEYEYPLDPSFEFSLEPRNEKNEIIFQNLQKLVAASLVTPVGEEHMYFAAMNNKSCKLTPYGKLHWKILKSKESKEIIQS